MRRGWGWDGDGLLLDFTLGLFLLAKQCALCFQCLPLLTGQAVGEAPQAPGLGKHREGQLGDPLGCGNLGAASCSQPGTFQKGLILLSFRELWLTLGWVYLNGDSFSLCLVYVYVGPSTSPHSGHPPRREPLEPCGGWGPGP